METWGFSRIVLIRQLPGLVLCSTGMPTQFTCAVTHQTTLSMLSRASVVSPGESKQGRNDFNALFEKKRKTSISAKHKNTASWPDRLLLRRLRPPAEGTHASPKLRDDNESSRNNGTSAGCCGTCPEGTFNFVTWHQLIPDGASDSVFVISQCKSNVLYFSFQQLTTKRPI